MKSNKKQLTIGIPVYNEEELVAVTIETVYKIAEDILDEYEIIVIDDGSTDQTYERALKVISSCGNQIKVFRKKENQGVGAAFHFLLEKAKFPYVCLIPGDNAYSAEGIRRLFAEVGRAPLVISFRKAMNHTRTKL